ncbi:hypothetical protein M419DRAFT_125052, partial [Trichoderma reesei RUT C-30]
MKRRCVALLSRTALSKQDLSTAGAHRLIPGKASFRRFPVPVNGDAETLLAQDITTLPLASRQGG